MSPAVKDSASNVFADAAKGFAIGFGMFTVEPLTTSFLVAADKVIGQIGIFILLLIIGLAVVAVVHVALVRSENSNAERVPGPSAADPISSKYALPWLALVALIAPNLANALTPHASFGRALVCGVPMGIVFAAFAVALKRPERRFFYVTTESMALGIVLCAAFVILILWRAAW